MRCREAIGALLERELGTLLPARRAALEEHLRGCAACTEGAETERLLTADLELLRSDPPFDVDVAARVMDELGRATPPSRAEGATGRLGWAAAAAVAALVGLGGLGTWLAPSFAGPERLREARQLLATLRHLGGQLVSATEVLASATLKALAGLGDALAPLAALAELLQPLALGTLAFGALLMVGTILLVVGRDLRTPSLLSEEPP